MSFPRYPKYKASGVEWLGEVPAHWETSRLKHFFTLMNRLPESDDGIVTAFRDGEVTLRSNRRTDGFTNAIHEHGYQRILKGDLVIHAMDAFAGAIGVSDSDGKSTPVYSACEAKSSLVHPPYYGQLLRNMAMMGFVNSLSKGIRERSTEFRWKEASNIIVAAPPHPEQIAIAEFLDRETGKIDGLVAEQRRLMELLKEKRQAVISQAVSKGINPHAPMKPSGIEWLGDVPGHWDVKKIRHFAEVLRGKFTHRPRNDPRFYGGEFPFIQTGDITASSRFITEFKQTLNELGVSVSKEFPKGTLVMAIAANIGDVAILEFPAYFPDSIVGLVPKRNFDLHFLYFLMIAMKQPMLMTATVSTQMNLNVDQICSLTAAAPPLGEQKAIVAFLDSELAKFDSLIAEAQRAIDLLQERRTALISAAVTGQIDVRNHSPELVP